VRAMSETRVWLLRHGASTFNAQHRCQGCRDEPELTPKGREQACLSGERLSSEGIEAVISSPLRRASKTAEHVVKAIGAQDRKIMFETDARLREIELYAWEGLPLEEIPRRFPEQCRDWRLRPGEFRMELPNNEILYPVCSLYDRVRLFWNYLLAAYSGNSILLVSHGGTIRSLICTALGLGAAHFHSFQQSNCGISRLRFPSDSLLVSLDLLNDTAHLGERLPKLKEARRGVRSLLIPVSDTNHADIGHLDAALGDIVIDNFIVVGSTAHNLASQLFPYALDSFRVVSEAAADSVVDETLLNDTGDQLRNVAILGPLTVLRRTLQRQLGISDTAAESLDLCPLEITSVHRPESQAPPVLQAVNMLKSVPTVVGYTP
jgi:broad specificity phosphatase PhoE